MKAPKKLYLRKRNKLPLEVVRGGERCETDPKCMYGSVEYTRTDAFVEKAAEFLYNYNKKQVLKHGARATLDCGEYTINVDEFRKYMEGE